MATNLHDLFKPLSFPVSHAHFWLRHRCFLRVSPKPSSLVASSHSGIGAFLWISPEPSSLRLCDSAFFSVFETCWYLWPFACFCTHLMFNISFCCCRHNVSNIFVQLTEGRSARDQPKQPPAKKNSCFSMLSGGGDEVTGSDSVGGRSGWLRLRRSTLRFRLGE